MDETQTIELHPQYVVDESGNRHSVMLSLKEYDHLLEIIEDINDAATLDKAATGANDLVDLEQVEAELKRDNLL